MTELLSTTCSISSTKEEPKKEWEEGKRNEGREEKRNKGKKEINSHEG